MHIHCHISNFWHISYWFGLIDLSNTKMQNKYIIPMLNHVDDEFTQTITLGDSNFIS